MLFVPRLWAPPTLFNSAFGLGEEDQGEVFGGRLQGELGAGYSKDIRTTLSFVPYKEK